MEKQDHILSRHSVMLAKDLTNRLRALHKLHRERLCREHQPFVQIPNQAHVVVLGHLLVHEASLVPYLCLQHLCHLIVSLRLRIFGSLSCHVAVGVVKAAVLALSIVLLESVKNLLRHLFTLFLEVLPESFAEKVREEPVLGDKESSVGLRDCSNVFHLNVNVRQGSVLDACITLAV